MPMPAPAVNSFEVTTNQISRGHNQHILQPPQQLRKMEQGNPIATSLHSILTSPSKPTTGVQFVTQGFTSVDDYYRAQQELLVTQGQDSGFYCCQNSNVSPELTNGQSPSLFTSQLPNDPFAQVHQAVYEPGVISQTGWVDVRDYEHAYLNTVKDQANSLECFRSELQHTSAMFQQQQSGLLALPTSTISNPAYDYNLGFQPMNSGQMFTALPAQSRLPISALPQAFSYPAVVPAAVYLIPVLNSDTYSVQPVYNIASSPQTSELSSPWSGEVGVRPILLSGSGSPWLMPVMPPTVQPLMSETQQLLPVTAVQGLSQANTSLPTTTTTTTTRLAGNSYKYFKSDQPLLTKIGEDSMNGTELTKAPSTNQCTSILGTNRTEITDTKGSKTLRRKQLAFHNNILYKTELCRDFIQSYSCPRASVCQFAHGNAELRDPRNHPLYKTTACQDFRLTGTCRRGTNCFHIHTSVTDLMEGTDKLNVCLTSTAIKFEASSTKTSDAMTVNPASRSQTQRLKVPPDIQTKAKMREGKSTDGSATVSSLFEATPSQTVVSSPSSDQVRKIRLKGSCNPSKHVAN